MDKSIETLWNMFVEEIRDAEGIWTMYQREIIDKTEKEIEANHKPEMQKVVNNTKGKSFSRILDSFISMSMAAGGAGELLVFEGDKVEKE